MSFPEHLQINKRDEDNDFLDEDQLFRGYEEDDLDELTGSLKVETIGFPDFSCNWGRYSYPEDIRFRAIGCEAEGCYSFTVKVSRYNEMATPVHDPLDSPDYPNYSHVEIRALRTADPPDFLPSKGRKLRGGKATKMKYRIYLANNLEFVLDPRSPDHGAEDIQ